MAYKISLGKQVIKALQGINEPYYSSLKSAIYALADTPRPVGYKKLRGRDGYRIRVANYRAIYELVDDILLVDVVDLGHRKDIHE
jgi:mRNA interferase RelE/StbE